MDHRVIRTLNIRLLRDGLNPRESIKVDPTTNALALDHVPWESADGSSIYAGQIFSNPPDWRKFLAIGGIDVPENLHAAGAGAVLFIPIGASTLAVCFGYAHLALRDDSFVRQFGLRVVLNSVDRGSLRTMDLATPDAVTFHKRVQASRDSDLQMFGVDKHRDLARVAGGTPRNVDFARFVAGRDALSITCPTRFSDLSAKCKEILTVYRNDEYKNHFSWIDNIIRVQDKDIIAKLDDLLLAQIDRVVRGKPSPLHMSPPEIVSYTSGSDLRYSGISAAKRVFTQLSIEDYAHELSRLGFSSSISDIKQNHRVQSRPQDSTKFVDRWRVYDCFVLEASLKIGGKKKTHVLFSGEWFCVDDDFKKKIEDTFRSVDIVTIVGSTSCVNERSLIEDLDSNRTDLLKLDQTKINPRNVSYANIEPCDFMTRNGDLIHLKDGDSSGAISHLWSQGYVSAECLVSDQKFRDELFTIVKARARGFETCLPTAGEEAVRSKYRVVYGIMRQPYVSGGVDLPFFSKVSFQSTFEQLQRLGIRVAVEIIKKVKAPGGRRAAAKGKPKSASLPKRRTRSASRSLLDEDA